MFISCMATMHPLECLTNQTLKEANYIYIKNINQGEKSKRNRKYLVTLKVCRIFMHD
jgi:hypothetical protein